MKASKQLQLARSEAAEFNEFHPVGSPVEFEDAGASKIGRTLGQAEVFASTAVVRIDSADGMVALSHVKPILEAA